LLAVNQFGASERSSETTRALGSSPSQPNSPYKYQTDTPDSITLAWIASSPEYSLDILGYQVFMDRGEAGRFKLLYNSPLPIQKYKVTGLIPGERYHFGIKAININGESVMSTPTLIYACIDSFLVDPPTLVSSSKTSLTIEWHPPNTYGCEIKSYSILRNNGDGTDPTIPVDPSDVQNKPSLREYEITGLSPIGATFRLKLSATTIANDEVESGVVSFILASVPSTPPNPPTSDASITNDHRIKVQWESLAGEDIGSPILSYEIQMDDGHGGHFQSLGGFTSNLLDTSYTIEHGIESGKFYRFRYRIRNANGWSEFSPISRIKAATLPAKPVDPIFDKENVKLILIEPYLLDPNDGRGSPIIRLELFTVSAGPPQVYTNVTSYDGTSSEVDLKTIGGGLGPGEITLAVSNLY
jgi:hypothetical protein